jgi:hypothetical protein
LTPFQVKTYKIHRQNASKSVSEKRGAAIADKLSRICCRAGVAERDASYGMGECRLTPSRVKTDVIHRQNRMKIRVDATRRRDADKLPRNVAAVAWPSGMPVTEWVNVAWSRQGRKRT